jgi:hypothetical protein
MRAKKYLVALSILTDIVYKEVSTGAKGILKPTFSYAYDFTLPFGKLSLHFFTQIQPKKGDAP